MIIKFPMSLEPRIEAAALIFNLAAVLVELALISTMSMELHSIVSVMRPHLARR